MARNAVQFQRGLSEPAFEQQYGTEEQCRAVVIASRWPNGFECPVCGGRQHSLVASRDLYQCTKCRRQTPLCQSSCRADRIGTFGGADSKQWLGTDRHTRTG